MTLKELKNLIVSKINTNGNRSITGISLQDVLNSIVNYASKAIRPDTEQTFTSSEQRQARKNIGAVGVKGEIGDAVVLSIDDKAVYPETYAYNVNVEDGKKLPEVLNDKVGVAPTSGQDILMYKDITLFPRTSSSKVEMGDGSTLYSKWNQFETYINVLNKRSNETKEKVDTFLADADTSAEAINKLKELQEYIKNDETSASQMLAGITQNKSDIANIQQDLTENYVTKDDLQNSIVTVLNTPV